MAETDFPPFHEEDKASWTAVSRYTVQSIPVQNNAAPVSAIYAIRNLRSGNFYIGSSEHVVRRLRAHLSELRRGIHHSLRLQWAWKTHGEDNFELLLLEYCAASDLIARESEFVRAYSPAYNTAVCMVNGMKGRKHTPEAIAKMKQNRKGKGRGPRVHSEQHRKAISRAMTGRKCGPRSPMSAAQKAKISKNQSQRWSILANNPKTKPVEIDGVRYDCCQYAARALNVSASGISRLIKSGKATPL